MHIDSYEFGTIIIDGRTYRNDLLIWPGRILSDWWRQESHLLRLADVFDALNARPEVLVVGTGAYGRMEVDHELAAHLKREGIDLLALPTREACREINELADRRSFAAALHLTC